MLTRPFIPIREDLDLDPASAPLPLPPGGPLPHPCRSLLTIPDIKIGENQPLLRLFNHADPRISSAATLSSIRAARSTLPVP